MKDLKSLMELTMSDMINTIDAIADLRTIELTADGTGEVAWLVMGDGSETGIVVNFSSDKNEQVLSGLNQFQHAIQEELCRLKLNTSWPQCLDTQHLHPMEPDLVEGRFSWICPLDSRHTIPIGSLS